MTETLTLAGLGRLRAVEVLGYFDGPKIVGLRREGDRQLFIAHWLCPVEVGERWLFVPVSETRYKEVLDGEIDLRSAYLMPELGMVALSTLGGATAPVAWRTASELNDHPFIPEPGVFLKELPTTPAEVEEPITLPGEEFLKSRSERRAVMDAAQEVRVGALATKRERISVRLSRDRHHVPGRLAAAFLLAFQHLVDGLARVRPGGAELNLIAVPASSLHLELASRDETRGLFDESDVGRGLQGAFRLMNAGANTERIKAELEGLPPRTAGRYLRLIDVLQEATSDPTFVWGSPSMTARRPVLVAALSRSSMGEVAAFLSDFATRESESRWYEGILVDYHMRRRQFEFDTPGTRFIGSVHADAISGDMATIGRRYRGLIHERLITHAVTGHERPEYTLMKLEPVADGDKTPEPKPTEPHP